MGDIADYYNDHCERIDDETAVTCKYCHKEAVWEMTPAGWRLFDINGELHDCNDPFELVRQIELKNSNSTDCNKPVRIRKIIHPTKSVPKKRAVPRHRSD